MESGILHTIHFAPSLGFDLAFIHPPGDLASQAFSIIAFDGLVSPSRPRLSYLPQHIYPYFPSPRLYQSVRGSISSSFSRVHPQ
ncbi:hypothetical protein PAXRUDRAFT_829490 [Paxillus rubicundulus Ve08.2h10]|uniref:Uncharacterized protein n=1 Tax=Paxillus rubicundulus Ve08.2h10 TaxID=930991 RepID=A0A0D0E5Y6_9AGAM|nr:hypothetical protein PAXRUDRAFT_829490 [Paxillus rubicundulus Ve08.2h10]